MWSIGCIFAELLSMIRENVPKHTDRKPIFPGKSCFPLSPDKNSKEKRSGFPFSMNDQMFVIFQVLGTPTADDQSFILDPLAVNYIKALPPT